MIVVYNSNVHHYSDRLKETLLNVEDAIGHYLQGSGDKLDAYAHQELNRFARAIGVEKIVADLTPPQVAKYAENVVAAGGDVHGRLGPVKEFLAHLHKKGLSTHSLSSHVKIPRANIRAAAKIAQDIIEMSESGIQKLKSELNELKGQRETIAAEIQLARSDGDISENSPLDAARERQGQAEARIRELEDTLSRAVPINTRGLKGRNGARVGATVVVQDTETNKKFTFHLVDSVEVDPSSGKISLESPMGKHLHGKLEGDEFQVTPPKGDPRNYRLGSVKF